jgi:hypothetical protein
LWRKSSRQLYRTLKRSGLTCSLERCGEEGGVIQEKPDSSGADTPLFV